MGIPEFAARLVLAVAFALAGLGKLRAPQATRRTLVGFGAPDATIPLLAVLLPAVELLVALALLFQPTAWAGAVASAVLLIAFTAVMARAMAQGHRPSCNCFGQSDDTPIGLMTLARNAGLLAVAAPVIVYGPGASLTDVVALIGASSPSEQLAHLTGVAIVSLLGVAIGMLARLNGRQQDVLERLDAIEARLDEAPRAAIKPAAPAPAKGLPIGAPAPRIALPDLTGTTRTLAEFIARGRPVLLLFVSPSCAPCAALMADVARWQQQHAAQFTAILISKDGIDATRAKFGTLAAPVLVQPANDTAAAYASAWTPAAVLVSRTGRIASAATYGVDAIRALVAQAGAVADVAGPGEAPAIALPDLDGRDIDLHRDYRGRDTVVLFWRPGCSYCHAMLDDVRRWEARRGDTDATLLVVSSESVDANRALGLDATIVLNEDFSVGRAYGVGGTPSAVLVDGDGRLASAVAVGKTDVMALLGEGGSAVAASAQLTGVATR